MVVVGASIAGLSAARNLAEAGLKVVVLERSPTLPGPRTLIATAAMERHLRGMGRTYVLNRVAAFELAAGDSIARVGLTAPDLVFDRHRLIVELSERVFAAGGEIRTGIRVTAIEPALGGWAVRGELRGSRAPVYFSGRVLVAADGASSCVASQLGHPRPAVVSLVQAQVDPPPDLPPDTSRIWFDRRFGRFFVWSIPEGAGRCAIGLISEQASSARHTLDAFLRDHRLKSDAYQSARVPLYGGWIPLRREVQGSTAFFLGDAAGHVKVTTVGGVVHGLDAAVAATDQILGRGRRRERRLKAELELHRLVRRGLDVLTDGEMEDLVRVVGERRGKPHAASSRDNAALLLARVVAHRPGVIGLGSKALFRILRGSGPPTAPL